MKKLIKKLIKTRAFYFSTKAPFYLFYKFVTKLGHLLEICLAYIYRIEFINDWLLCNGSPPNFYKHLDNLYHWRFDATRNIFTTAPSLARLHLRKNQNVLDLCCGDGSTSYLFFSDIAKRVDSIDANRDAIKYAKKYFGKGNINFIQACVIEYLEGCERSYDLYYMGSAYDYFSSSDRRRILEILTRQMTASSVFVLKTPIWDKERYEKNPQKRVGAKDDFADDLSQVKKEMEVYFSRVETFLAEYANRLEVVVKCKL